MPFLSKKVMLTFCFCLLWFTIAATKSPVMLNVDIPAKTWKAARLRNLPKNAVISMSVETNGEIAVAIVDSGGYVRYPKPQRPLFLGRVEKRLSFSVTIPKTDNYYAVLDNRLGHQERAVTIKVGAARGKTDQITAASKILPTFEHQLHEIFLFNPFYMGVKPCDKPRAFVDGSGIIFGNPADFHDWMENNRIEIQDCFPYINFSFSSPDVIGEQCIHYPRVIMGQYLKI